MKVSAIICTYNPHPGRLDRTLAGLAGQSLPTADWELIVVDNASSPALPGDRAKAWVERSRVVAEPRSGLTYARLAGVRASAAEYVVFVDDDNVLSPDYLQDCVRRFESLPRLGLAGGRVLPEFECPPEPWHREFFPLLALRDLGERPIVAETLRPPGSQRNEYPTGAAPVGAGMAARRAALEPWLGQPRFVLPGRSGQSLGSADDNDIVLRAMAAGWAVGYFPELVVTHLIPAKRLEAGYLARLNYSVQESWYRLLGLHAASSWGPLTRQGAALRKLKAWFTYHAWQRPAGFIRWRGACGHFDGRVP